MHFKKPVIRIFRWDATEIYKDGVLIGYVEQQGELRREIMLDAFDVIVWGGEDSRAPFNPDES